MESLDDIARDEAQQLTLDIMAMTCAGDHWTDQMKSSVQRRCNQAVRLAVRRQLATESKAGERLLDNVLVLVERDFIKVFCPNMNPSDLAQFVTRGLADIDRLASTPAQAQAICSVETCTTMVAKEGDLCGKHEWERDHPATEYTIVHTCEHGAIVKLHAAALTQPQAAALSKTSGEVSIQVCDEELMPTNVNAKNVDALQPDSAQGVAGESVESARKTTGTLTTNLAGRNAAAQAVAPEPPQPKHNQHCECYRRPAFGLPECPTNCPSCTCNRAAAVAPPEGRYIRKDDMAELVELHAEYQAWWNQRKETDPLWKLNGWLKHVKFAHNGDSK